MGFFSKYPYTDFHELNLDWVLEQIKKVNAASGVTFNDSEAALGATNVQDAIDALQVEIANVALISTVFVKVENEIALDRWQNGHVYTHLQTINSPTLIQIINAIRNGKVVCLEIDDSNQKEYFYMNAVTEIPGDYQHIVEMYDPFDLVKLSLVINGLNDDQNIFCEILPSVQESIVESFNGRNGAVVPADHDYTAEQIDYDNQASQLLATNVQDAIDEVHGEIPEHVVNSFNNREGDVIPTDHDYNAEQIDYDNTASQLQATDVQAAIDEIIGLVITAGVGSFNGRSGIVLPQSGDYTAAMIPISTSDTNLPNTVHNVQEYIEYMNPAEVTVTLTINGAKEDSITIYDSNDVQVGSCIFASDQTSGTCQISVPAGGGSYKFISSVAKDTTTGSSDYEKTVVLTDTLTQTVNVMPDNCLYWFGNEMLDATGGWYATRELYGGTITKNTNSILLNAVPSGGTANAYIETTSQYDFTGLSTLKILKNNDRATDASGGRGAWIHAGVDGAGAELAFSDFTTTGLSWASITITQVGDNKGYTCCRNWQQSVNASMEVYALYAE
ncbi:MAG: hypothetical protein J6Q61_00995 [Bacteroidales bacterium]|nr:hypothetical protein [Bacteroidales bacterium]